MLAAHARSRRVCPSKCLCSTGCEGRVTGLFLQLPSSASPSDSSDPLPMSHGRLRGSPYKRALAKIESKIGALRTWGGGRCVSPRPKKIQNMQHWRSIGFRCFFFKERKKKHGDRNGAPWFSQGALSSSWGQGFSGLGKSACPHQHGQNSYALISKPPFLVMGGPPERKNSPLKGPPPRFITGWDINQGSTLLGVLLPFQAIRKGPSLS